MTAPAFVEIGGLVHSRPGMSGGRPCVYPTGITVARVAYLSIEEGLSAEEVIEETCSTGIVSIAAIHAALAFYYQNRAAIDADTAERLREYDEAAAAWPTSLANPEYRATPRLPELVPESAEASTVNGPARPVGQPPSDGSSDAGAVDRPMVTSHA